MPASTPYDGGRDEAVTPAERAAERSAVVGQVAGVDSHGGLAPNLAPSAAYTPSETDRGICQESYWHAERKVERAKRLLGIRAYVDAARELKSAANDLLVAAEHLEPPL